MPSAFGMTGGLGTLMHASEELTTMAAGARRDTLLVLKMVDGTVPIKRDTNKADEGVPGFQTAKICFSKMFFF